MSEQQLRKALGAVNDLNPPPDDLFVERATSRGRARAHRRRSWVVGTAAAVVLVGAVGGTWVAGHPGQSNSSASGSAPEAVTAQQDSAAGAVPRVPTAAVPTPGGTAPAMPPARDLSAWFTGPMTRVRVALDALTPTLEARFADVFAGMYAADAGNTRIVLCVTRSDTALEDLVRSSVPAGSAVEYRTVANSFGTLRKAEAAVLEQRVALQAQGVTVLETRIDARTNRVVVTTTGDDHGLVGSVAGGDLVTVVVDTTRTPGRMLPGGSTQGPLHN